MPSYLISEFFMMKVSVKINRIALEFPETKPIKEFSVNIDNYSDTEVHALILSIYDLFSQEKINFLINPKSNPERCVQLIEEYRNILQNNNNLITSPIFLQCKDNFDLASPMVVSQNRILNSLGSSIERVDDSLLYHTRRISTTPDNDQKNGATSFGLKIAFGSIEEGCVVYEAAIGRPSIENGYLPLVYFKITSQTIVTVIQRWLGILNDLCNKSSLALGIDSAHSHHTVFQTTLETAPSYPAHGIFHATGHIQNQSNINVETQYKNDEALSHNKLSS